MKSLRMQCRSCLPALGVAALLVGVGLSPNTNATADDVPKEAIGVIEGSAIQVSGPMTVEVIGGLTKTMLRSGSEIQVKSGSARIELIEGGQLVICGPAHFSVLKWGGAITVALDSGTIRAHVNGEPALTIYTPQIQAKPIAVGDAMEDIFVGLDQAGAMCVRANRGAVRVEQQLTGQSIIVPQGGDIQLTNGQLEGLRNIPGHCVCESARPDSARPEIGRLATEEEVRKNAVETKKSEPAAASAEKPEPIYQVFMPPLRFDASAKVQPEPDPQMILLVRRIRVRPTLIFQGRVEGEAIATLAASAKPETSRAGQTKPVPPVKSPPDSFYSRIGKFFRQLWGSSS